MASLKEIVKEEVAWYASGGAQDHQMYAALDDENQVYIVNAKGTADRPYFTDVVIRHG